ncbi:MAG: hypothetical protein WC471_03630 [Candidatus Woesearchaeota archaeon]
MKKLTLSDYNLPSHVMISLSTCADRPLNAKQGVWVHISTVLCTLRREGYTTEQIDSLLNACKVHEENANRWTSIVEDESVFIIPTLDYGKSDKNGKKCRPLRVKPLPMGVYRYGKQVYYCLK